MDKIIKIVRAILVTFFLVWALVYFSISAFTKKDKDNVGSINKFIVELYKTPKEIKKWYKEGVKKPYQAVEIVYNSNNLYEIGKMSSVANLNDSTHLLYYKFKDENSSKIVLQNIKSGEIEKSWDIPLKMIKNDLDSIRLDRNSLKRNVSKTSVDKLIPLNYDAIVISSPLILDDDSLIFHPKTVGYLYKIDKNSKLIWKSEKLTHHSIELDENGNIWTCSFDFNNKTADKFGFMDNTILCLDKNGKELYFESLTTIFEKNNIFKKVIESTPIFNDGDLGYDPYHLNDVQPTMKDGKFWKKGDVFLSLRSQSMVMLFRPKTSKVIWKQQGPWLSQHDVNIQNDSIISIFNNNTSYFNNKINTTSNIALYNFENDESNFFADGIFSSETEGRHNTLTSGNFLIEETNKAIYHVVDSNEKRIARFYIPYYSDSKIAQYPGWATVYTKKNDNSFKQQ